MSNLTVRGNALGTGTVIVESPNTNTNRTITLPDATTTLVGTDATQTLTNKTINGGALTLMTAQNSTSGTFIDFTGIPSWAKRVSVLCSGVSTSGTSPVIVQVGTSSGVVTTGYVGALGATASAVAGTTNITNGFGLFSVNAATDTFAGKAEVCNITGNTWVSSSVVGGNSTRTTFAGGTVTLSGVLDRVRITTVGGADTFDAGSINVMYEG